MEVCALSVQHRTVLHGASIDDTSVFHATLKYTHSPPTQRIVAPEHCSILYFGPHVGPIPVREPIRTLVELRAGVSINTCLFSQASVGASQR